MPTRRDQTTKKQKRLIAEIDQLLDLVGWNSRAIQEYDPAIRTVKLESILRSLTRGVVVDWYTLVDELLADQICWFYFGRKRSFIKLWRIKAFRIFNHHILQDMYPLEKLRLIRAVRSVPKRVIANIQELSTVRNAVAHAYFPENLTKAKPNWNGQSIFSLTGLRSFQRDMFEVRGYFMKTKREYRRSTSTKPKRPRSRDANNLFPGSNDQLV
jgi:hypothetical protein